MGHGTCSILLPPDVLILFEAAARLPFFQFFYFFYYYFIIAISEHFIALLVMKCLFPEIIIHEEALRLKITCLRTVFMDHYLPEDDFFLFFYFIFIF